MKTPLRIGSLGASGNVAVDETGGIYNSGIIRGVSVLTRGEAEGKNVWVTLAFLQAVAAAINSGRGCKSKFGHASPWGKSGPEGTLLGRIRNAAVRGDVVVAELHLMESSRRTPYGDLGRYVLGLAKEDPALFGLSVVFDAEAERAATDPANAGKLPELATLRRLWSIDVVDDPAGTPGLFPELPEFNKRPTAATPSASRPAAAPPPKLEDSGDFIGMGRRLATKLGIPLGEALSRVARECPTAYERHMEQARELGRLRYEHKTLVSMAESARRRAATQTQEN